MHPVRIPQEQVNDESVLLVDWLVADGDLVQPGQPVALIETSKAATEIEAPIGGFLRHGADRGAEVTVGAVFCHIANDLAAAAEAAPVAERPAESTLVTTAAPAEPATLVPVSPASESGPAPIASSTRFSAKALELMEQHQLTPDLFHGKPLVREADVQATIEARRQPASAPAVAPASPGPPPLTVADPGPVPAVGVALRTEELPRMKRVEARYLTSGRQHTLQSVVSVLCPTAGLKAAAAMQPKLGGNSAAVIVYETARLLRKYPALNAFHDHGKISYYEDVNIGFAVDGGQGLKAPVIAHADRKGLVAIAEEIEGFLLDYVNGQISVAALAGGTFTITDLSGEDVVSFHPLINQGQAAILGVGAEQQVMGGGCCHLILSFDHQLAEGRMAARFLKELRDRVVTYELAAQVDEPAGALVVCSTCRRSARQLTADDGPLLEAVGNDGGKTWICRQCLTTTRSPRS